MLRGSGTSYRLEHLIGINGHAGLCALEKEVAFAAANRVVIHDIETNCQRFIEADSDIICLATNHSRTLLAVATKNSSDVEIYETTTLTSKSKLNHRTTWDVECISVSRDLSVILTITKAPEATLTLFVMNEKFFEVAATLVLSTIMKGDVKRVDICPSNNNIISLQSGEEIGIFSLKAKSRFISLSLNLDAGSHEYTTQCWLQNGGLAIGTFDGTVLVIGEDRNMKQAIDASTVCIQCISCCPKGFAVGCRDGSVLLFQRVKKEDAFVLTNSMTLPEKVPIASLGMLKFSDSMLLLTESNELIKFHVDECDEESLITVVSSLNKSLSNMRDVVPTFGYLFVDTCVWLPLIVVGGYDGVLRIVNSQSKQVKVSCDFEEPITGVSLHPTGTHVLVSTTTQVFVCSIHPSKVNFVWKVTVPGASFVKFSVGGDRFGILIDTIVQVHDFYIPDYPNINTLRGHSKPIVAFEFGSFGDELVTIGSDSIVSVWDRKGRATQFTLLSPALFGCVDWDERAAFISCADGCLKKVSLDDGAIQFDIKCDFNDRIMLSLPRGKLMISSARDGSTKMARLHDGSLVFEPLSKSAVTSAARAKDGSGRIIVVGEGCLSVYNPSEIEASSLSHYCPYDGIIMISRNDLATLDAEIKHIEIQLEFMKNEHVKQLEAMNAAAEEERRRLSEAHQEMLKRVRSESSSLIEAIEDAASMNLSLALNQLKAEHNAKMTSDAEEARLKIAKETDITTSFERRCDESRNAFKKELTKIEVEHAKSIELEMRQCQQKMTDINEQSKTIIESIEATRFNVHEWERKIEEASEMEIAELWSSHNKEVRNLQITNQLLSNEKSILQQRLNSQSDDLKELNAQISSQEDSYHAALAAIAATAEEIEARTQEIKDIKKSISIEERKMSAFSQANLEDEQVNIDLKHQLKRLEHDHMIYEKEGKLKESLLSHLTDDIKHYSNLLSHLNVDLGNAKTKYKQTKNQLARLQDTCLKKEAVIKSLEDNMFTGTESALSINDHTVLKTRLRSISSKFLGGAQRRQSLVKTNEDQLSELGKKVNTLKKTIELKKKTHVKDMDRLKREHALLTKELEESKGNGSLKVLNNNTSNIMKRQSSLTADLKLKTPVEKSHVEND